MADPTDKEQLALELINEARLDPTGNAARYITSYSPLLSNDPDIQAALKAFNVNGNTLKTQFEALDPVQPLAWNDLLADAADAHSQNMINQNNQSHVLDGKDPGDRLDAVGYDWNAYGENIFLHSESVIHGHAAFMVDWGVPSLGHRNNIMGVGAVPSQFREIGIGIVDNGGEESTTHDFGNRFTLGTDVLITGVAYNDDKIDDDFYSLGEGVANLEIVVGADSDKSTASGGYTLQTDELGAQFINFSGGGLAATATYQATLVANNNYKLDIVDIGTANPILRTSLSGVLTNSTILNITGIGMLGLNLAGTAGDNVITGAKGGDGLDGGANNDTLNGGLGDDTMGGGTGADKFMYGANFGADTVTDFNSGQSDKIVFLSFGAIQSVADLFAMTTVTEAGGNTKIDFGGGNSLTLNSVTKNSLVDGDFVFAAPATVITGTAGKDVINATSSAPAQPFATNDDEIILGLGGDDVIDALGGSDQVEGGEGNDNMKGGAGIDTLTYENATAGVTVNLSLTAQQDTKGAGKDTVSQFENLTGSAHNDSLTGDKNVNTINGGAGDDVLNGGLGSDTLDGGAHGALGDTVSFVGITTAVTAILAAGNGTGKYKNGTVDETDTLTDIENLVGGTGADQLSGDGNINKLDGGAGNDKLFGDAGADTLIGGIGNDELNGDDGDDLLIGGAGADKIDGGNNNDTVSYAGSTAGITIVTDGVTLGKGGDAAGDVVSLFTENIIGSAKDDKIFASAFKNHLQGGAGNDTLATGSSADTLDGGTGNDILIGDDGADILIGGDGIDTASYAEFNISVNVTVNGAGFGGNAQGDQLFGIENLIGTGVNDILTGDAGVNSLTGGGFDDQLRDFNAGDGIDVLLGGDGNDTITGHAGDKLDGGTGLDTLVTLAALLDFVTVDLSKNLYTEGKAKSTLVSFEHVTGSDAQDTLTGTAGINTIIGHNDNDVIEGLAGADILDGDGSNLPGSSDTVVYALSNAAVTIDLTQQGTTEQNNDAPSNAQIGGHATGDKLYGFENVVGSKFNDTITGDNFDNIIEGGLGNDILDGAASGANGNTVSYARATANVTVNLTLVGEQNTGGGGKDTLSNFLNITGGKGADILTGDPGKNTIDGGAGNDIIQGGAEADMLIGGLGIDTLTYANSSAQVLVDLAFQGTSDANGKPVSNGAPQDKGDAQNDLLWGFENLTGTDFVDNLSGDSNANIILGGKEFDVLRGRGGNDTLDGGEGSDWVQFDYLGVGQNLTLVLGAVDKAFNIAATKTSGIAGDIDTIKNIESVLAGGGDDVLTGNSASNLLNGRAGNDRLFGMDAGDTLLGEGGDDLIEGGLGDDDINGGNDNDTAGYKSATIGVTVDLTQQGAQQDTVGAGLDTLNNIENLLGSAKNDTLTGDGFDNIIEGGLGIDILEGGLGIDTLSYAGSTAAVTVSLAILVQQNTVGAGLDTATGFENLTGGSGADKLTGDDKDNVLSGGAGNDVLSGGDGTDTYISGAGADKITDGGTDGKGDLVYLSGADGVGDTYDLGPDSNDTMEFKGTTAITLSKFSAASIENLNANGFNIVGTTAADNIDFSAFTTVNNLGTIDGLAGNDKITGSLNADTIFGGIGNDILDGKAGADHLHGGLGTDTLTGGADADTFHIKWGEGADKITDFVSGVDAIELHLTTKGIAPPLSLVQASGAGIPANTLSPAMVYDQDDGRLYYDSGPGAPVLIATLTNIPASLQFSDFTFT